MHPVLPPSTGTSQTENAFLAGRAFVFANGGDRLLFPARMACTLFSLVTALLVYAAGRRCFGMLAGVWSLFLFAFDANLLAHGTLISTDVGSARSLFATVCAFYRYSIQPSWRLLLVAGLLAGLALVTKSTGILIAPMLLLFAAIEGVRERRVLRSGGIVFASVKDYDELVKTRPTFQGPSFFGSPGEQRIVHQVWDRISADAYDVHQYISLAAGPLLGGPSLLISVSMSPSG